MTVGRAYLTKNRDRRGHRFHRFDNAEGLIPWYEVTPSGHDHLVTVWDSRAKANVIYRNVFSSYNTAMSVGRSWKKKVVNDLKEVTANHAAWCCGKANEETPS